MSLSGPEDVVVGAARLVWQCRDGSSREFPLGDGIFLIGREGDADIQIEEPLVSRAHARIERRPEGFYVVDLGSTNHTRVNGDVVRERALAHGDEVRFGRARCTFFSGNEAGS